jgi:redox-sensitive bicupin YhaK (pirin superfamily)
VAPAAVAPPRAVRVELIAGRLLGARAPMLTLSQATVARVRIPAGATFVHAVDSVDLSIQSRTVVLYALSGEGFVGRAGVADETRVTVQQLAIVTQPAIVGPPVPPWPNTDEVRIRAAPEAEFDLLWLSGLPVGVREREPILQRGPFALRSEEEILQAIEDYRAGRFGTLP